MASRLDKCILRGEIDNTERGIVRGKLWLLNRQEPVVLELRGNAWRDLAGARLVFSNKSPAPQLHMGSLPGRQEGAVGDITASRKVKHVTVSGGQLAEHYEKNIPLPFEWRNSVYIEWFSQASGRVVIESADFDMSISERAWELDEAEDQAQQLANQHAMRNYLAGIIQRPDDNEMEQEMDDSEEAWEKHMQSSDRLTDAHLEAIDKYGGEGFDNDQINFVMGWDHMIEGGDTEEPDRPWLDEALEQMEEDEKSEAWKTGGTTAEPGEGDEDERFENSAADFEDLDDDDDDDPRGSRPRHPLLKRTRDLALKVMDFAESVRSKEPDEDPRSPLNVFIGKSLQISGKTAGVLSGFHSKHPMPRGMILATMKRCLGWADEARSALADLQLQPVWKQWMKKINELDAELAGICEDIMKLRAELGSQ